MAARVSTLFVLNLLRADCVQANAIQGAGYKRWPVWKRPLPCPLRTQPGGQGGGCRPAVLGDVSAVEMSVGMCGTAADPHRQAAGRAQTPL